jgi:exosortase A-associated hydrolase 1
MRRLLTFACGEEHLSASLDEADGTTGVLMVTGGSQTRVGSHRMYERLAKTLAEHGHPCLRFDRRGVGDSSGEDPGFRESGPDLSAAAAALRDEVPSVDRVVGLGLCDGATAIALYGASAGISDLILVNPWLIEASSGEPPPAAIRSHYRQRLLSVAGWKKLLSGSVDLRKLAGGLKKAGSSTDSSLAAEAARGLARFGRPAAMILANGDGTAAAASAEIKRPAFAGLIGPIIEIASDSHTFARRGDQEALEAAVLQALARPARTRLSPPPAPARPGVGRLRTRLRPGISRRRARPCSRCRRR